MVLDDEAGDVPMPLGTLDNDEPLEPRPPTEPPDSPDDDNPVFTTYPHT
jgi:hypothetical protein